MHCMGDPTNVRAVQNIVAGRISADVERQQLDARASGAGMADTDWDVVVARYANAAIHIELFRGYSHLFI
jgi:hypothetical protein